MSKIMRLSFAVLLALTFSAVAVAQSQATGGQIVGTIKNPNGELVPGATVTITNAATGLTQTLVSNDEGGFRAVSLPPGDYTIEVTAAGFGKATQTGYKVEVGSSLDANITLSLQNVSEEVLVTAASVETTQVQTPTVINLTSISRLPINGRRFQDFVLATPSAQTDPSRNQISLVGQRGINANIQIDGADYTNPFFGGLRGGERSNNAFSIPQSAIREFQVVASGFNAEFGRSTGGIVNAVTKSGTNDFSGNAFYLLRPAKFAHRNAFGQIAAPTQKQFGGSIGGPFFIPRFGEGGDSYFGGRDKTFFFASYEQQILNQERAVLFERLPSVDPNIVGVGEAHTFYRVLEGPYTQTNGVKAFLTRFDFNLNQQNQFNIRYNYATNTAANAVSAGTSLQATTNSALSNNGTEGDRQHTVVAQLTTFFTSTVINELRLQYSKEDRPRLANELSPLVNNGIGSFGTVSFLPTTETDIRKQVINNLSLIRGNHSVKLGFDISRNTATQLFAQRQTGNFSFSGLGGSDPATLIRVLRIMSFGGNTTTADANANTSGTILDPINRFDDTRVRYQRQIGSGLADLSATELAFYAQDSWRVRPNFTLSYGLRYEAQLLFEPETTNTALTDLVANTSFAIGGRVDPRIIPDQTKQWAPRLGFAWDPWNDGKGVIRGYGGIYYARIPLLSLASPGNNFRAIPGNVQLTLPSSGLPSSINTIYEQFLSIGINLNNVTLGSLPILTVAQMQQINANIAAASGRPFNPNAGLQLITSGDQLENPRAAQFGIGVEREVARGLTIGTNFDYVNTVHLNRNRDYDLPAPRIRPDDRSLRPYFGLDSATRPQDVQQRPISSIGNSGYLQVIESSARSLYRGLTFRAQMRRKLGQFDAFYVLSKTLDDDSTERNSSFSEYDNSFDLSPEYSFSRLDRRHQVALSTVLNAPFGFELGVTARFTSAPPIDVSVSSITGISAAAVTLANNTTGDLNQDRGNFSDRPYTAPGVPLKRNAFRNTPFRNVNLRIQRNFRFGERVELSPSFEVFNVFKFKNIFLASTTATNYGNPGVNELTGEVLPPSNPNFLKIRDANGNYLLTNIAGDPLQMQFGIRMQF